MKKLVPVLLVVACMVFVGVSYVVAEVGTGSAAPSNLNAYAVNTLTKIGTDGTIVKAVKKDNASGEDMADVLDMDVKWKAEKGTADYMETLMNNDCAKHLNAIRNKDDAIFEIFVMDNMGAVVCETDKTGDYWQGDEAKWQQSYNDGKGGSFYIEPLEYDPGMKATVTQVSVPVMDGMHAIGAITFGINVDNVK